MQRLPDHDLVLLGEGPSLPAAQNQVQSAGLTDRVHFLGWRDDVLQILRAAQLFLLPSRWEGMPHALLEAMACGLPVVAMDVEGVREVVGVGQAEQIATAGDAEEFLKKAVFLGQSPTDATRLGQQNRQFVAENYPLQNTCEAYAALYGTHAHCQSKASGKKFN